jgi:hypothetical protein
VHRTTVYQDLCLQICRLYLFVNLAFAPEVNVSCYIECLTCMPGTWCWAQSDQMSMTAAVKVITEITETCISAWRVHSKQLLTCYCWERTSFPYIVQSLFTGMSTLKCEVVASVSILLNHAEDERLGWSIRGFYKYYVIACPLLVQLFLIPSYKVTNWLWQLLAVTVNEHSKSHHSKREVNGSLKCS